MSQRISQQQLESYLWGAATLLRGTIDAGDYKQFIFPLLFYKRVCDVFDEETQAALAESGGDNRYAAGREQHRFQIPPEAHWREVRQAAKNVGAALQSAMRAIETANPDKLYGIFGDAQWTNKDRLSDAMLRDLVEHFSTLELTVANLPEDELGQGYEYLIKKFADDAGHTAAEFYTNRTVVHLMTEMLDVQPGESVYDPTCGSGGMLLSCITHLRRLKKEWRNVRLYGQERNLMTSSIARMNCFLHGVEDFRIERGDTLSEPKFVQGDRFQRFDVVLANPPYSIKQWDRDAFASDPWGRNLYGTPPQGRADYAFQQHIICSMSKINGRSVVLWPHGLLSREEESEIRRKLVAADLVEAVIGLGRKLFYNSGMESCLFVCRQQKSKKRNGKILFINAEDYIQQERAQSFLSDTDIASILKAYRSDKPIPGISAFATLDEVLAQKGNLNIKLYVHPVGKNNQTKVDAQVNLDGYFGNWLSSSNQVAASLKGVIPKLQHETRSVQVAKNALSGPLFDRSKWKRVKLGDVAMEYAERVDDPAASGFERYIGSDCIDRHDFKVRRWDAASSVSSSMKAFHKGDYLLVRRSLYGSDFRERAPRADFEGICSADILTIRENSDIIAEGFLIAVLYSPKLWQFVIAHAKGSLTRRIKWRELAGFEFNLPPRDQQRRIAEILWAVDEVGQQQSALRESLSDYLRALRSQMTSTESAVGNGDMPRHRTARVRDVASPNRQVVQVGPFGGSLCSRHFTPSGTPVVKVNNITEENTIDLTDSVFVSKSHADSLSRYRVEAGDVLIAAQGDTTGRSGLAGQEAAGAVISQHLARVAVNPNVCRPEFLAEIFRSDSIQRQVNAVKLKTTRPGLNTDDVADFLIPLPSVAEQDEFCSATRSIVAGMRACSTSIGAARHLLATIVGTISQS